MCDVYVISVFICMFNVWVCRHSSPVFANGKTSSTFLVRFRHWPRFPTASCRLDLGGLFRSSAPLGPVQSEHLGRQSQHVIRSLACPLNKKTASRAVLTLHIETLTPSSRHNAVRMPVSVPFVSYIDSIFWVLRRQNTLFSCFAHSCHLTY